MTIILKMFSFRAKPFLLLRNNIFYDLRTENM